MLEKHTRLIESSLENTLKGLTAHCLREAAEGYERTVAEISIFAGRVRLDMDFIQQEDVEFVWVDDLNTQGLLCSFKLGHEMLLEIKKPSLNLQRLRWQLLYPADTKEDFMEVSNTYLLATALFRRIGVKFDDDIVDVIEAAIVEMTS